MDKNHILEILKDNSIDDENLANALAEIFTHLAHDREFSEEISNEISSKLAKDSSVGLF